jgi:hypothetical protein
MHRLHRAYKALCIVADPAAGTSTRNIRSRGFASGKSINTFFTIRSPIRFPMAVRCERGYIFKMPSASFFDAALGMRI